MLRKRLIPILLLENYSLVKTLNFKDPAYIGDPCNTIRIFNELEVDELIIVDIKASIKNNPINYDVLKSITDECFMPLCYGGGIKNVDDAKRVFDLGLEKICLNTASLENPQIIKDIANIFGSQSLVISIDVKKDIYGHYGVYSSSASKSVDVRLEDWVKKIEDLGAGEILLTSIDHEGTWKGFDYKLLKEVIDNTILPVIAHGGCGSISHIEKCFELTDASAVGLGSMVVYQKEGKGVLINFPDQQDLNTIYA
tara:strand:+ start:876 stop:1637 length:762 start_codon:yes stop_codon:yes gene_type:complete